VGGALVGGASLIAESFSAIINAAAVLAEGA
jgi:triosephosphate isomerase